MKTAIVTVGIDEYWINTDKLVWSVFEHEPDPDCEIVVIDNAAKKPYLAMPFVHRLDEQTSYAAAINYGISKTDAEWLLTMNNDVICNGEFVPMLEQLLPGVYGKVMMNEFGFGSAWLDGWIMVIHREVWDAVGPFDENFLKAGFEDADYCWRAELAGYPFEKVELPFYHKDAHTRYTVENYFDQRSRNMQYLREKWSL